MFVVFKSRSFERLFFCHDKKTFHPARNLSQFADGARALARFNVDWQDHAEAV
jgi:hypothetical protein